MRTTPALIIPVLFLSSASAFAGPPESLAWDVNARLRHESVDDAAFGSTAEATTLRLRAALKYRLSPRLEAVLEGEGIAALNDGYDSTANGRRGYPVVADPEDTEINQAALAWRGDTATFTAGRQRLLLDNQRWVSNVGWRQNEQTFDAVATTWKAGPSATFTHAWLDRVHRVNGDRAFNPLLRERNLDTHLLNLAWGSKAHRITGYAYLHEDRDVRTASTDTFGARYAKSPDATHWGLNIDVARQKDNSANPDAFALDYWLLEPAWKAGAMTLKVGWEHLGSNGRRAVQTPLGLVHSFNGWADRFVSTPAAGLDDRYVSASGTLPWRSLDWVITWHDYRADVGGAQYGREWNVSLARAFSPSLKGLFKVADYQADAFSSDTRKVWLQLEWAAKSP